MAKITRKNNGSFTVHGKNGISGNLPSDKVRSGPQTSLTPPTLTSTSEANQPTARSAWKDRQEQRKWFVNSIGVADARIEFEGLSDINWKKGQDPSQVAAWVSSSTATDRAAAAVYGQKNLTEDQRTKLASDPVYAVRYCYAHAMPPNDSRRDALLLDEDPATVAAALRNTSRWGEHWTAETNQEKAALERLSVSEEPEHRAVAARFTENKDLYTYLLKDATYKVRDGIKANPLFSSLSTRERLLFTAGWVTAK